MDILFTGQLKMIWRGRVADFVYFYHIVIVLATDM